MSSQKRQSPHYSSPGKPHQPQPTPEAYDRRIQVSPICNHNTTQSSPPKSFYFNNPPKSLYHHTSQFMQWVRHAVKRQKGWLSSPYQIVADHQMVPMWSQSLIQKEAFSSHPLIDIKVGPLSTLKLQTGLQPNIPHPI